VKISVGVVLLPPAWIARRAIRASARLGSELRLGGRRAPHVTLAMACVDVRALGVLKERLRGAAGRAPLDLTIWRIRRVPSGRHVSVWYEIARTRDLLALHGDAVRALEPHRRGRATRASLALRSGETVSASTLRWIDRFPQEAAFGSYRPHITLGKGEPDPEWDLPLAFRARRLALFQLGPHCTCVRRLAEVRLGSLGRRAKARRVS
jgi:hypothetical protein